MAVPHFPPVENKSGLTVTNAVVQLVDSINVCKQVQSFHGAQILRVFSDKGAEFVNQEFETAARQRGIHVATSPAHQPQSKGLAERLVGLAKQTTRRLLLARRLPKSCWTYAMGYGAELLRHKSLGFP